MTEQELKDLQEAYDYANQEPADGTRTYIISGCYEGPVTYSRKDHKWHLDENYYAQKQMI